jgi:peptide/nickel transport system substrate-binding protein
VAIVASVSMAALATLAGCSPHLPKAPPPPSTSKGAAATTVAPTTTTTGKLPATSMAGPGPSRPGATTSTPSTTSTSTAGTGTRPSTSTSSATTTTTSPPATTTTGPPPIANVSYDADAVASYAVGPQPSNWNIDSLAASASYSTLAQVLAQVWPSAFEVGASGVALLNTSLLDSAAEVSDDPQTVVYQINPHAVWSDGAPITYRDFVYNWEAQSGKARFSDVGATPFTPIDQAGYDDIAAVRGNPAQPYTVTVVFSSPYPAWRSLFSYLVPAHIAQAVGFDTGFTDPVADLVSGGPFMVAQLQDGYSLELVRNSLYWGNPANLASVTYYFTSGPAEMMDALTAGELDVATVQASAAGYQQLQATGGLHVWAGASAMYEDLDFNESAGPFRSAVLRQAVAMSVDRAGMASAVLGPYGLAATPVENRALLPGDPGYFPDGTSLDQPQPTASLQLLTASGYTESGTTLEAPGGKAVVLSLFFSSDDPLAAQLAAQVVTSCAAIGIKVDVVSGDTPVGDVPGATGAVPPPAGWQMAIELRQVPVFPATLAAQYGTGGPANVDGYSSTTMDALLDQIATAKAALLPALYDQVDTQAWKDYVDLPLVPVPVIVATNHSLLNLEPGPYYGDIAWDEQDWGFAS